MRRFLSVAVFILLSGYSFAQQPKGQPDPPRPRSAWEFKFTVVEVDKGKPINERNYTMKLLSDKSESIRSGNQIPILSNVNNTVTTTYLNFGLQITCNVQEVQNGSFQARVDFEVSSIVGEQRVNSNPLVRTVGGSSTFVLHPGKKEVVISADDVNTDHRYEVAVLATRLD